MMSLLVFLFKLSSIGRFFRLYLQRRLSKTCLWSLVWLFIFTGLILSVCRASWLKYTLLFWTVCVGYWSTAWLCSHVVSVPGTGTALGFFLSADWLGLSWTWNIVKFAYTFFTFPPPAPIMPLRSLFFCWDFKPCANLICVELAGSTLARVSSSSCCWGTEEINLSWWVELCWLFIFSNSKAGFWLSMSKWSSSSY